MSRFTSAVRRMFVGEFGNDFFDENREQIQLNNYYMLKRASLIAVLLMTIMTAVSFIIPSYADYRLAYAVGAVAYLIIFLFAATVTQTHTGAVLPLLYVFAAVSFCAALVYGVVMNTRDTATIYIVLIVIMPLIITDKVWRINILQFGATAVFCVSTWLLKSPEAATGDTVNCMAITFASLFIDSQVIRVRLRDIYRRRKLVIQRDTDALTLLRNRRRLYEELARYGTAEDSCVTGAVMVDIDFFKRYNDAYGHQTGDECLKRLAAFFADIAELGSADVYRYGGEEFLFTTRGLTYEGLGEFSQRIVDGAAALNIQTGGAVKLPLTVSAGYASFEECAARSGEELIGFADGALYEAKRRGRNMSVGFLELGTTEKDPAAEEYE